MNASPEPMRPEPETRSMTLGRAVGTAAGLLASEVLSNGDRAELRRVAPEKPFTPALWKVLLILEDAGANVGVGIASRERRWSTLLMAMSFCVDPNENLHDYQTPLGRALAEAGWSELRFVRLLRAEGEALDRAIRRMAQYLANKSQKANWADVAHLLFEQAGGRAEEVRLRIARSYYRALYAAEKG